MFSPVRGVFWRVATRALPRVQITDPRVQANPLVSPRASRAKVALMTLSLDDLARAVVVRDTDVMRLDLGDRWAKRLPAMPTARIYAATQGGGFLQLGEQLLTLEPGEILLLP